MCRPTVDYKKGKGTSASLRGETRNFGAATGGWGDPQPTSSSNAEAGPSRGPAAPALALAPAPRLMSIPSGGNGADQLGAITTGMASLLGGMDSWEVSLENSDFDDGFQPRKKDNKPPLIQKAEWTEGDFTYACYRRSTVLPSDIPAFCFSL